MRSNYVELFLRNQYYKMFFLITHLLINKYYPNIALQFLIGFAFYAASFVILKDLADTCYEDYKHCLYLIIGADIVLITHKSKMSTKTKNKLLHFPNQAMPSITNPYSDVQVTSSDVNDLKLNHHFNIEESNVSLFSPQDPSSKEKDDRKGKDDKREKDDKKEKDGKREKDDKKE